MCIVKTICTKKQSIKNIKVFSFIQRLSSRRKKLVEGALEILVVVV